jgi:hypothetical protein
MNPSLVIRTGIASRIPYLVHISLSRSLVSYIISFKIMRTLIYTSLNLLGVFDVQIFNIKAIMNVWACTVNPPHVLKM